MYSVDIAKWFINQKLDESPNSMSGNMKLQKLLFFSQLIYMCENNGKTMYDDEFNAFEHGMVLETVRQEYKNNYAALLKESNKEINFPSDIIKALTITKDIFGGCSADELSELSHQFQSWNKYLKKSINNNGTYDKQKSKVPYSELKKELYRMKKVLDAYKEVSNISEENNIDF